MYKETLRNKSNDKLMEFFELCRALQLSKEDILDILKIEERTYKKWGLCDIKILSSYEITALFMITELLWEIYETNVSQSLQSKLGIPLLCNNEDRVLDIPLSYSDSSILIKEYDTNRETKPINQYGCPTTTGGNYDVW